MSDGLCVFLGGALIGIMLFTATLMQLPFGVLHDYHEAIDLCQEGLPRNQTCVITAIPIKESE